jgi:hypothetical protein
MTTDPVRIVPVRSVVEIAEPVHGAAPAAPADLVYNGGPLLGAVEVFVIFWGTWWHAGDGASLADRLNGFFDFVLTSELIDQLAEYSAGGTTIGHGSRTGATTVTEPAPTATVTDASIQRMLPGLVDDGTLPQPSENTLFFLYLPPSTAVVQGGARSCQAFCGYHNATADGIFYAVMPYPGCRGCTGDLEPFDALTSTSSHELCEAITDPIPGSGWYDEANGENGDICAWQTRKLGEYTMQLEWSNRSGRCV